MIARSFVRGSYVRRLAARAVVVLGAVSLGGLLMRSVPREQTLIFPIGSTFPKATHFAASWRQPGDEEPRGGVSLNFDQAPPLQIREHARLPNGDYIVTIDILEAAPSASVGEGDLHEPRKQAPQAGESAGTREGLQTNIERRVSLAGGEALIALAVVPREPSVSE